MTIGEAFVYEVPLSWACVAAAAAVGLILVAALVVALIVAARTKRRH